MDLKTVELPVETDYGPVEPDSDAGQPSDQDPEHRADSPSTADPLTVGDNWQEALPKLQALWEHHLDRWPDAERLSIDRAGDEPGSWRGENSRYLDAADNAVASHSFEHLRSAEREISSVMRDIAAAVPGATLAGFEHRLKDEDRFKEKVVERLTAKLGRSAHEVTNSISDTIRYTVQFNQESYAAGYWMTRQELTKQGYELSISRNMWADDEYKGINTRWLTADNRRFEVQFHTPESFQAKQLTHEAYERLRAPNPRAAEVPELEEFQRKVSSSIPAPTGVAAIPDFRKREH